MSNLGVASARTWPVAAGALILAHLVVSVLIVLGVIEASLTAVRVIHLIGNLHDPLLIGPLAALLPSAAVLFWGSKAIVTQLDRGIASLRRHRPQILANCRADGSGAAVEQRLSAIRTRNGTAGAGLWIGAVFLAALSLAIAILATTGVGEEGIGQA